MSVPVTGREDQRRLNILMLGRQGSGKGTQATRLASRLGIPWVSTGEMFRQAAMEGTEFGLMAKRYMEAGELVPDDVTVEVVRERLSKPDAQRGLILDGFPRTRSQAEALDRILGRSGVDLVINIEVPEAEARQRMIERAEIEGRADDTPEAIDRRLALYLEQTRPLLEYYGDIVVTVDGVGIIEEVFERCLKEVEAAFNSS